MQNNGFLVFLKSLIKRKFFYLFQIIFFIIAYFCIESNIFGFIDFKCWEIFINWRNQIFQSKINQTKSQIVLVGIDEKFFSNENISSQGFHRGYFAKVIDNINKSNPSVVGIDIFFEKKYNFKSDDKNGILLNQIFGSYDQELSKSITNNNILATVYDTSTKKILLPDISFYKNNFSLGHVNSFVDLHLNLGVYTNFESNNRIIYPLSLQMYLLKKIIDFTLDNNNMPGVMIQPEIKKENNFLKVNSYKDNLSIPIGNFNGNEFIFTPIYIYNNLQIKYYSFYDIYKGNFVPEDLKNKIVFIGATDKILNDVKFTLKGNIPGVMIHINQFISFLMKDLIYPLNKQDTKNIVFIIIILNIFITIFTKKEKASGKIVYLLAVQIIFIIILSFIFSILFIFNKTFSIFLPLGTILMLVTIHLIFNGTIIFIETFFLKEDIQKLFNLFVGEKISDKKLGESTRTIKKDAEEKNTTIFFSDIAGFTTISEKLSPTQNVKFINYYLSSMSEDIVINKGFIDKYIGDAIMAFWEEEDGPYLAAKTAISNILGLPRISKKLIDSVEGFPEKLIECRIGLNYGKVIIGDIGSENYKLNYTIIGDHVNLASRLESINKYYGTKIIMTQDFHEKIKNYKEFVTRKIDKIMVKGKNNQVIIYELLPIYKNLINAGLLENLKLFLDNFEKGLNQYFNEEFILAIESFKNAQFYSTLFSSSDKTSEIFIERCEYLVNNRPNDWDGIWKFKEK